MNEFVTISSLATFTGSTLATLLIVQYIKPLFPKSVNTRAIALAVAFIIMSAVTILTGGGPVDYLLSTINSFAVAAAAMGTYEVSFAAGDARKKEEISNG